MTVTVLEAALNQMKDGNNSPFPFSLVPEKVGRLTHAFVACFCEAGDLLTQWRGYSNAGGGYSLGFDSARLFEIVEGRQLVWGPVQYGEEAAVHELRDELQAAQRALEETLSDFVLDGTGRSEFLYYAEMRLLGVLTLLIPFMKHDAFSGEKEWRIVEHRSPSRPPEEDVEFRIAGNTLVPYIPISLEHPNHPAIPLSSVRLGPRIPPFAKESVEAFLERAGIGRIEGKRVKVDGSSVPFRSLV